MLVFVDITGIIEDTWEISLAKIVSAELHDIGL